jgi:hypothetical protein
MRHPLGAWIAALLIPILVASPAIANPPNIITSQADAPFAITTCDVSLGPHNSFTWLLSFRNYDKAQRRAMQFVADLVFRDVAGGTILELPIQHNGLALPARGAAPAQPPVVTQMMTASDHNPSVHLEKTSYVECRPLEAHFTDGTKWTGTAPDPRGLPGARIPKQAIDWPCRSAYTLGSFQVAENDCLTSSNRFDDLAHREHDPAVRHTEVAHEFRGWMLAARSASRIQDTKGAARFLDAALQVASAKGFEDLVVELPSVRCLHSVSRLDACMTGDERTAVALFIRSSPDERSVFLAHGGNPASIHGVPALIHPAHGTSKTETWTYRSPAGNVTRTYTFVDGKQKTTLDTRALKIAPPS